MRFDEVASRAGKHARDVGRSTQRPAFSVLRRERVRRTWFAAVSTAAAVGALIVGTVSIWPETRSLEPAAAPGATSTSVTDSTVVGGRDTCPVTVPGDSPFTPASQAPPGPPALYDSVWYGTPDLWTMVDPDGQVWSGLPVGEDGSLTEKTFWFAEGYVFDEEPLPDITVTLEDVEGIAPTVQMGGPGTNGTHPDLGSFMLVGVDIPAEGCWKVTAEYRGASLSYVVWVGDDAAASG